MDCEQFYNSIEFIVPYPRGKSEQRERRLTINQIKSSLQFYKIKNIKEFKNEEIASLQVDGKPKKSKKKSSDKDKEKSKTTDRKKKKASKTDDDRQNERDELEEFLNGPVASGVDSSYEAF